MIVNPHHSGVIPRERDYSLDAAFNALKAELTNLKISYNLNVVGDQIKTVYCTLMNSQGKPIAYGSGKGELYPAKIGSVFEACEHYFSEYSSISSEKITYQDSLIFYNGSKQSGKLPIELFNISESHSIPLINYESVDGTEICDYPLALVSPEYLEHLSLTKNSGNLDKFNYSRLENYSTNSGIAIGMNKTEAVIHGLLENIERYSLSEFISNVFLLKKQNFLRVVQRKSLPNNVKSVLDRVQGEINSEVTIFKMPNKYGIPAFCSWTSIGGCKLGIGGYGCSLLKDHAILRSLYEVAQAVLLDKHIFGLDARKKYEKSVIENLTVSSFHLECAKFNLNEQKTNLGFKKLNFDQIENVTEIQDTSEYLNILVNLIYSKGETPFQCELNSIGEDIKVVSTFITGEDRFFNVLVGKNTFPNNIKLN